MSSKQEGDSCPCSSGPDKCIQPWAQANSSLTCNRCEKPLHQLCAAIDASKAPAGQFENPESIRICYSCLRFGESPNNFGVFSMEDGPPLKKTKTGEKQNDAAATMSAPAKASATSDTPEAMSDLDWPTLLKPHSSILELVQDNKVCSPQITKKTIWWRLYHTWNMDDFGNDVAQPCAYCNLCGKVIKMSKVDRSPTPLKRHLQIHHKDVFKVMHAQKLKDGPVVGPPGSGAKHYYHSKNRGRKEVTRSTQLKVITQWIIETDQPLEVVESASFREMASTLVSNPRQFNAFDKDDVTQYMTYLVFAMRHQMKEMLANQSLIHVQESWTAANRCSYQVDRVHWIDEEFKLQNLVIACDFETAMARGEKIESLWESVGVTVEKQIPVTVSNCKDAEAYNGVGGEFLFHGVDHELNKIAEIAYTALGADTMTVVKKARALVETVQSSTTSVELLLRAQTDLSSIFPADQSPLPLIENVLPDAWWSTNEMIGRLVYLRKALEYLMLDARFQDYLELLTKQEWDILERLQQVWEPLNIASQLLHKQKFVTISLVPMILQIVGEDLSPDSHQGKVKTCLKTMLAAWEDRFGKDFPSEDLFERLPQLIWVAHVLDPRFKSLEVLKSSSASEDAMYDALLDQMVASRLLDDSLDEDGDKTTSDDSIIKKSNTKVRLSGAKRGLQRLSERFSPDAARTKKALTTDDEAIRTKIREECQTELNAYKAAEGMKMWIEQDDGSKDFHDPLPWWQSHHHQEDFPTLWILARKYLCIPATCAPSERAFDPEMYANLSKRCQAQASTTRDTKLLKENAKLVEAFEERPDSTAGLSDGGTSKIKVVGKMATESANTATGTATISDEGKEGDQDDAEKEDTDHLAQV